MWALRQFKNITSDMSVAFGALDRLEPSFQVFPEGPRTSRCSHLSVSSFQAAPLAHHKT